MKTVTNKKQSWIPAVHRTVAFFTGRPVPPGVLTRIVRDEIVSLKKNIHTLPFDAKEGVEKYLRDQVAHRLDVLLRPGLKKVINGTGIILHTGLGRAPYSDEAKKNLIRVTERYCNIELDLATGERGDRTRYAEELICLLTGAESALVVNNNAAAVLLMLNTLAFQKEVIVSRGELVEIGGSFRIPEVMEKSGAVLREVGTTNKTHFKDYAAAFSKRTGLILSVHTSNYRVLGFTTSVPLGEIAGLAKKRKIPLAHDLGGGALVDLTLFGLPQEPVVSESIASGADVVTFSADKILGGAQAGIAVGKKRFINAMKKNPLIRALRCDKMAYAVLEATLKQYLLPEQLRFTSPVLRMLTEDLDEVSARADEIQKAFLGHSSLKVSMVKTSAQAGSGTLPLERIPSMAVAVASERIAPKKIADLLRSFDPPVLGYVKNNVFHLDMRTVEQGEVATIIQSLKKLMTET